MPTTEVTEPMLLDSTGQDIVDKLQRIADAITPTEASEVSYDNSLSGLAATDLQAAVDELAGGSSPVAVDIPYDNTLSGMQATDVQGALDELAQATPEASAVPYDNTLSGLTATTVQDAIDELLGMIANLQGGGGV